MLYYTIPYKTRIVPHTGTGSESVDIGLSENFSQYRCRYVTSRIGQYYKYMLDAAKLTLKSMMMSWAFYIDEIFPYEFLAVYL